MDDGRWRIDIKKFFLKSGGGKMNSKTEELLQRTFDFGVNCLQFLDKLPKTKVYGIITFQLEKASTSLGSNYEEAQSAESAKDFIHKVGIVLKESRESNYWLRILDKILADSKNDANLKKILTESFEFKKIFTSIKLTAEQNLDKKSSSIKHHPSNIK
ncbi:MAG: four helix bundle protein [Ignavibacteria bacterium]